MAQVKKVLEIRVTFTEKQQDLYDYIRDHSSASAFLKDLALREMRRDNIYINSASVNTATQQIIISPQQQIQQSLPEATLNKNNTSNEFDFNAEDFDTDEFDFDTDDLDF